MLLVLNLPMIGLWVKVLQVPYGILFPLILVICLVGAYTVNNSTVDVCVPFAFGILGYLMRKLEYEPAPFILAFILSPIMEMALRRSLVYSDGSFTIFPTRPISAGCLIVAFVLSLSLIFPMIRKRREKIIEEAEEAEAILLIGRAF